MSLDLLTNGGTPSENAPKRTYSWLLPVGLVVGFALLFIILFGGRLLPGVEVEVAQVETLRDQAAEDTSAAEGAIGRGEMLFQASGWIEPDPYITYVPVLVNGIVEQVHVLEGDVVKEGQLLAELISDDQRLKHQAAEQKYQAMKKKIDAHCMGVPILKAKVAASRQKIEAGKALLEEERDNLKRLESLGANAVSEQSIVQAGFSVTRLEAQLAQVEAELPELLASIEQIHAERKSMEATLSEYEVLRAEAKLALDRTKIHAPMDGVVLHLHVAPGKKRMLNMDDPKSAVVVELYDPRKLQARIDVPLTEAAGLMVGQEVEMVTDLLANQQFAGRVTRISGQADIQRNTLQAKVQILDPDVRMRPEMLVRAKFFAAKRTSETQASTGRLVLYVDRQALVGDDSVWVVSQEGRAELRKVELGTQQREGYQQVRSGLRSGELVIVPPHDGLSEGARVEITKKD